MNTPSLATHIQVEFFLELPSSKGSLESFFVKALNAFQSGRRIKLCLRLRFLPEDKLTALIESSVALSEAVKNQSHAISQAKDRDGFLIHLKALKAQKENNKYILTLIRRLLYTLSFTDVFMEDSEYFYHPIHEQKTFEQVRKLVMENDFPFWVFVCRSDFLGSEEQEIIAHCL